MGQFSVRVRISHPTDPSKHAEIDMMVNTGATLTWAPQQLLESIGAPRGQRRAFQVADGRIIERETAGAVVGVNSNETYVTVVAAEPGDAHLLGVTALESLGLAVDPIRQKLIPQVLLAMPALCR
jgi:clan AA aspartic protease